MIFQTLITKLSEFTPSKLDGQKAHIEVAPYRAIDKKYIPQSPHPAAVLLLFYPYQNNAYFILIQRPKYKGNHSGQIALPGGKREQNDRSIRQTALREAEEETNINQNKVDIVGELTPLYIPPSNFMVTPIVGISQTRPDFNPDDREVDEIIEVSVDDLLLDNNLKKKEINLDNGGVLNTPYFDLNSKVVWGATAMILNEIKHYISGEH